MKAEYPGSRLTITVNCTDDEVVLCLGGRLDIDSSPALRHKLLSLLDVEFPKATTVDLAEATYVDLSGIATLIETLRLARKHHTSLRLRGLHGRLLHLLEVTGMLSLFDGDDRLSAQSGGKVS
jgi:anti-anti-sigma factor